MNFTSFYKWLFTFITLLLSIPILINFNLHFLSVGLGFVLVLFFGLALFFWVKSLNNTRGQLERVKLNTNDVFWLNKNIPFYEGLSKSDKIIFEDRIGLFLSKVVITEVDKSVPEKSTCLYVAASAVIAFWGLPYFNYSNLREVLVYPSNFNMDNTLSKIGHVQGKVYHGGLMNNTMILSLPALIAGFSISNDKKNVGVHEFAHLLDKADGVIDGVPYDMCKLDREIWTQLAEQEINKINNGNSSVPDYGATSMSEFFAVLVEYYKECPNLLKLKHPELYGVLSRYFSKV